jgi:Uma2 family endonuclease
MTSTRSVDEPTWQIPARLRRELLAYLSSDGECGGMTYEEFLDWADEDTLAEWVDGKVVMTSPASRRHQDVGGFLYRLLLQFTSLHSLGKVLPPPFQMKLPRSGREPDVIFVANEHLSRLRHTFLDGPADLVVEILSPESIGRDRGDKFFEYQEARIPEYWLIDPTTRRAEFYQLDARGAYGLVAPDDAGVYRSPTIPGFWIEVAWLWQDPPPPVERALLAIDREAYTRFLRDDLGQYGMRVEDDET